LCRGSSVVFWKGKRPVSRQYYSRGSGFGAFAQACVGAAVGGGGGALGVRVRVRGAGGGGGSGGMAVVSLL